MAWTQRGNGPTKGEKSWSRKRSIGEEVSGGGGTGAEVGRQKGKKARGVQAGERNEYKEEDDEVRWVSR